MKAGSRSTRQDLLSLRPREPSGVLAKPESRGQEDARHRGGGDLAASTRGEKEGPRRTRLRSCFVARESRRERRDQSAAVVWLGQRFAAAFASKRQRPAA